VQEGRVACASFPPCYKNCSTCACACAREKASTRYLSPWSNDVVARDALVLLQDGKIACASYPPCWNDVIRDVSMIGGKLSH